MMSEDLRALLVCPACHSRLHDVEGGDSVILACNTCGIEYPVHSDIPILLPPELRGAPADDGPLGHKVKQIAHWDEVPSDDFDVIRPRGTPALYGHLMHDKFRRSIIGLDSLLPGSTALVTCGGPGMDAEFLADAGARVILSDISLGALMQARERFRRFGKDVALVVADAEALPFRDASVDLVYVHDGLHHLERPALGMDEMARVARRAVSVSEPARSFATNVAVRLGVAARVEDAGNQVMRLTIQEIVGELRKHGFDPIKPHRYGMFYRHSPGTPTRLLSKPVMLTITMRALDLANRILGRFGNKLAVQAVRRDAVRQGPLEAASEVPAMTVSPTSGVSR